MILNCCLPKIVRILGLSMFAFFVSSVPAQDKVDFVKDIKPIIEKHCISCHGPEKEEAYRTDIREDAMDYIEPGSAEDSDFYLLLVSDDEEQLMPPPEDGDPLTKEQITLVKTWINQGADWPEDVKLVDTSQEGSASAVAEDGGSETNDGPDLLTTEEKTQQIFNAFGSLHPAAIHLPIGLLLAAGFFALFSLRGNFVMGDCAYYCLWLGTLGAIGACWTGWWFSPMEHRGSVETFADLLDQDQKVFWHRTGALIATAVSLLLALFAMGARNRDPDGGTAWKLGLILLAAGIGWVGHTGGELHYPDDHYKDLNAVFERAVGQMGAGGETVNAEKQEPMQAEEEPDGEADGKENGKVDGDMEKSSEE